MKGSVKIKNGQKENPGQTVTKLLNPSLFGNVLTLSFQNENGVAQDVNIDLSSIKTTIPEGTLDVLASRDLAASDNGKTLLIKEDNVILTMVAGLGEDFTCNFEMISPDIGVCQIVEGVGFALNAPLGDKLLVHYTANLIKTTGVEEGNLRGELTP